MCVLKKCEFFWGRGFPLADLIADGFITDPDRTDEENEVACLGLIEAVEEPGSHLAKLFEVEVVPLADDEGL
jgi:hypothetical protein